MENKRKTKRKNILVNIRIYKHYLWYRKWCRENKIDDCLKKFKEFKKYYLSSFKRVEREQ